MKTQHMPGKIRMITDQEELIDFTADLAAEPIDMYPYEGFYEFDFRKVAGEPLHQSPRAMEARMAALERKYRRELVCGWTQDYVVIEVWLESLYGRAEELVPAYQIFTYLCEIGLPDSLSFRKKGETLWAFSTSDFEKRFGVEVAVPLHTLPPSRRAMTYKETLANMHAEHRK